MAPLRRRVSEAPTASAATLDVDALLVALDSEDADARRGAALSLAGKHEAAAALAKRLGVERDRSVREAIGGALLRCASEESAHAIAPLMSADDATLRNEARELLHALPHAELVAEALLTASDPDVRMFAIEILATRKGSDGAARIAETLASERDINVLAHAVEQLGLVGTCAQLELLRALEARWPDEEFLGFAIADARERMQGRTESVRGSADQVD